MAVFAASNVIISFITKPRENNKPPKCRIIPNMTEREFLIYLDQEMRLCRYRHYHVSDGKEIVEFRVQLEILVGDEWYAVVRYDTAHGKPHRDILHPNGEQTKDWFEGYSVAGMSSRLAKRILWKTGLRTGTVLSRR